MLVDVLTSRQYVPPHNDVGWYAGSNGPIDHAPKITKQDRFVSFSHKTMDDILTIQRALGDPWCMLPNGDRLIMHNVVETNAMDHVGRKPGIWVQKDFKEPVFCTACGRIGRIMKSTYAGSKSGNGNAKLMRILPVQNWHQDLAL